MKFLLDLAQIEQSGLLYTKALLSNLNFVSKTGGYVAGDLSLSGAPQSLFLSGLLKGGSGIYFDGVNGRIGIGTNNPQHSFHIKQSGNVNVFIEPTFYDSIPSKINLINNNIVSTGIIQRTTGQQLVFANKNQNLSFEEPSQISFSNKNLEIYRKEESSDIFEEIVLNDNDAIISKFYASGTGTGLYIGVAEMGMTSIEGCIFTESGYSETFPNLLKQKDEQKGSISYRWGRAIGIDLVGREPFQVSTFKPKEGFNSLQFSINGDFNGNLHLVSPNTTGFYVYGTKYVLGKTPDWVLPETTVTKEIKKRHFWPATPTTIKFESGIDDFYTGKFTVYIKKIAGTSSFLFEESDTFSQGAIYNGLTHIATNGYRDINDGTSGTIWGTIFSGGASIDINRRYLYMTQESAGRRIHLRQDSPNGNGNIMLLKFDPTGDLTNNKFDLGQYFGTGLDYSIKTSVTGVSGEFRTSDSTEITMDGGHFLEFGLVDRIVTEEEETSIYSKARLDEAVFSGIKFLFKFNTGKGTLIVDEINGYTGTIKTQGDPIYDFYQDPLQAGLLGVGIWT